MTKKILVLLPILPQKSYSEPIVQTLLFLKEEGFNVDYIDPLDISNETNTDAYYQACQLWLEQMIKRYDAFIGFSFGGVILQQCFHLFENMDKTIVLFSTPTFANNELKEKLGKVVQLCKEKHVEQALSALYAWVFYPNQIGELLFEVDDKTEAASRLMAGLQLVLETNSQTILQHTSVAYLHLIGEKSNLVNIKHVFPGKTGSLLQVPNAGMRVLEDNFSFCKKAVLERLRAI